VQTVIYLAPRSCWAYHNGERFWCVLQEESQFIWLFKDAKCKSMKGLVALEACEVRSGSGTLQEGTGYGASDLPPGATRASLHAPLAAAGQQQEQQPELEEDCVEVTVAHRLRMPHTFVFGSVKVCRDWYERLRRATQEKAWRSAERAQLNARLQPKDRLKPFLPAADIDAASAATPPVATVALSTEQATQEAAFREKFAAAQAGAGARGWTAADLVASAAEAVQGGVQHGVRLAAQALDLDAADLTGPGGQHVSAPLAVAREAMSKMTHEQAIEM
jgi:hypothetical protein